MMAGVPGPSIILLYKMLQTGMSLGSSAQEVTQIHEQIGTLTSIIYNAGSRGRLEALRSRRHFTGSGDGAIRGLSTLVKLRRAH